MSTLTKLLVVGAATANARTDHLKSSSSVASHFERLLTAADITSSNSGSIGDKIDLGYPIFLEFLNRERDFTQLNGKVPMTDFHFTSDMKSRVKLPSDCTKSKYYFGQSSANIIY